MTLRTCPTLSSSQQNLRKVLRHSDTLVVCATDASLSRDATLVSGGEMPASTTETLLPLGFTEMPSIRNDAGGDAGGVAMPPIAAPPGERGFRRYD